MDPVLVIEHSDGDGPGHFGEWLAERGRPMTLVRVHAGDAVPPNAGGCAGLCVLGGPMSANDRHLSHLDAEYRLIEDAIDRGVPVIGHCLGGQMLAKVLGASVERSPQPEIGWHAIDIEDSPAGRDWLGGVRRMVVLQWHREAFDLPAGAIPLAGSPACPRQAFSWNAIHLALQFHPEADRAKIEHWLRKSRGTADAVGRPATIQSPGQITEGLATHLAPMRRLACRVYDAWAHGLRD